MCLFNDWSARDIQGWEYQPLGPFLSKSFASTVSPWIVTSEALAPFRAAWTRDEADPQPMPYLESQQNRDLGSLDLNLQVLIETQAMRKAGEKPVQLSQSNFKDSYWTVAKIVALTSPKPIRAEPDFLHQPFIIIASPSSKKVRVSPFGKVIGSEPAFDNSSIEPASSGFGPDWVPLPNISPERRLQPLTV